MKPENRRAGLRSLIGKGLVGVIHFFLNKYGIAQPDIPPNSRAKLE